MGRGPGRGRGVCPPGRPGPRAPDRGAPSRLLPQFPVSEGGWSERPGHEVALSSALAARGGTGPGVAPRGAGVAAGAWGGREPL